MKRVLSLVAIILVIQGCSYQNFKTLTVEGQKIKTPYGKAKSDMYFESTLCFPKCEYEVMNPEEYADED